MLKARTARFYGWTDAEMDQLPYSLLRKYYSVIDSLRAQEAFIELDIASYPKMKTSKKKDFLRTLKRRAREAFISRSGQTPQELAKKAIRGMVSGK